MQVSQLEMKFSTFNITHACTRFFRVLENELQQIRTNISETVRYWSYLILFYISIANYFFSLSKYRVVLKYKDPSRRDININSGGHTGEVSDKQPFFPSFDLCFTFNAIRRDEVTGEWRRVHNEELNDLYSSPIRATCPAHLILLDFITRTILGE